MGHNAMDSCRSVFLDCSLQRQEKTFCPIVDGTEIRSDI